MGPLVSASTGDTETISVIDHGWHTDVALPATEARGGLAIFRAIFPGARTFIFGFGKRTFMIAPVHDIGDLIIGPIPGEAAIQVSAVSVPAATAFPDLPVATLALPPGGADAASAFIWGSIAHDGNGKPRLVADGPWPGSVFYASTKRYTLFYTCNTWTAAALRRAGLPVRPGGVVFAGQVLDQLRRPSTAEGR